MGEKDRQRYLGRKCPECGLPIAACNEIAALRAALRPFAEQKIEKVASTGDLTLEKRHFEKAREAYQETAR